MMGKVHRKKVGDKKAADEVASQIRAKLKLGDFSFEEEKPVPTFGEYTKTFLDGYSMLNHKQSTRDSYNDVLNLHILPHFGKMRLNAISRKGIKDFLYGKQQGKLSSGTVKIIRSYLSCILSQATDDEIIMVNPASKTGKSPCTRSAGIPAASVALCASTQDANVIADISFLL